MQLDTTLGSSGESSEQQRTTFLRILSSDMPALTLGKHAYDVRRKQMNTSSISYSLEIARKFRMDPAKSPAKLTAYVYNH